MSDPNVLFEETTDEINEDEAGAGHGEVPPELIELSIELQKNDVTPGEFMRAFGQKAPKKSSKKPQ